MKNNAMKLGTQTGSLFNHLMSQNQSVPVVGEGATVLLWTDRHAYTVREVSKDGKKVVLQRCNPKRIDGLGMSDCQDYDYSEHTEEYMTLYYRYGAWRSKYVSYNLTHEIKNGPDYAYRKELRNKGIMDQITDDYNRFIESEYTTKRVKWTKVNILFGERREYYDFSF